MSLLVGTDPESAAECLHIVKILGSVESDPPGRGTRRWVEKSAMTSHQRRLFFQHQIIIIKSQLSYLI